jgi:predicted aspartyl protease
MLLLGALAATADPPPRGALLAELPFVGGQRNRIFVNLAQEGSRDLILMLDTGASDSFVTPRYARSLGVSVRRGKSSPYRRKTLLGSDLLFWVDTSHSDTSSRSFESGLLGGTFLSRYVVELDFAERMVRLYDPKKFKVPKQATGENVDSFRFELSGNRPFVHIPAVDGSKKKVRLLLDTGAPMPLVLSEKAALRLGLDDSEAQEQVAIALHAGQLDSYRSRIPLRLGAHDMGLVPALVSTTGLYNQGGSDDSLIGYGLLSQFKVRIDYPRRRLWLERVEFSALAGVDEAATDRALGEAAEKIVVSGAHLAPRGSHFVVLGVVDDSAAQQRGVLPGDVFLLSEILEVDVQLAAIAAKLERGDALEVAREVDGISRDVELPAIGAPETRTAD